MKRIAILTFLAVVILPCGLRAQSFSPEAWVSGGAFLSNANASFSVTIGESFTNTLSNNDRIFTLGFQQPFSSSWKLTGRVAYDNSIQTPLPGVIVSAVQNGTTVGQSLTNSSGDYFFTYLSPGNYTLTGSCDLTPGSINSQDALLAVRAFIGLDHLTGLRFKAADVDMNGVLNAVDALFIQKYFVGIVDTFPTGKWLFEEPAVTVNANSQSTVNFRGIACGDANGSFIPGQKSLCPVTVLQEGFISFEPGKYCDVPVSAAQPMETGAVSLVLDRQGAAAGITEIRMNPGAGDNSSLVWAMKDNRLRISWYGTKPLSLRKGDVLMTLRCKLSEPGMVLWAAAPESAFGDARAKDLGQVLLSIPVLKMKNEGLQLLENIPNPFSDQTLIRYYLEEAGKVSLQVYSMMGTEVFSSEEILQDSGLHEYRFDGSGSRPGAYLFTLRFKGSTISTVATGRMVIIR